jgi:hypothetical protein
MGRISGIQLKCGTIQVSGWIFYDCGKHISGKLGVATSFIGLTDYINRTSGMSRYHRKVIRICAEDSPNVKLAILQGEAGINQTNEVLIPGLLTWNQYVSRRKRLDKEQQSVSLDARFYRGHEVLLFPEEVIARSLRRGKELADGQSPHHVTRRAESMGVDSAEGGDDSVWTVIDMEGIIFQKAIKTADTADIPGITVGLIREYRLDPERVLFDRGGGGKQHADRLRYMGYNVSTVGFDQPASDPHKYTRTSTVKRAASQRVEESENLYVYINRRAEMYGVTALLFSREEGFGVPREYSETLNQLKVIPKKYNEEGRLWLPPKDKKSARFTGRTLRAIMGRSPDHADSLVMAIYAMLKKKERMAAGAYGR